MNDQTVIVFGIQGVVTQEYARELRDHFGCNGVMQGWDGIEPIPKGRLVLTGMTGGFMVRGGERSVSINDIAIADGPLDAAIQQLNHLADEQDRQRAAEANIGKPTNPKDGIGSTKVPLHLVSPIAKAYVALAQYLGRTKYGQWNWRIEGARASVYRAALDRHMDAWFSGEDLDPADGTPHLANALACISILIECQAAGNLTDDRPPGIDIRPTYRMVEACMQRVNEQHGHLTPRHFTIEDTKP